ncbi:MAG: short-chain dehydrogenase [Phenylobacterium sp.]|nr:short-chain dehydrogenase [Phenylobacterium sp.]
MISLADRDVVVTGAGRGLGRAYAIACAAAGASVLVNDIDADCAQSVCDEIRAAGGAAECSSHSVADPAAAAAMVRQCCEAFGSIDGLINNAGLFMHGPAEAADPARARQVIEVNLLGSIYAGQAAMRAMDPAREGTIVNVISGAALGISGLSIYGASKGGVATLTTVWAMEKPAGITILGMAPVADTRMTRERHATDLGTPPEEIACLAVYLLSPAAKALHGSIVRLSQGRLAILRPATFQSVSPEARAWTAEAIAEQLAPFAAAASATPGLA